MSADGSSNERNGAKLDSRTTPSSGKPVALAHEAALGRLLPADRPGRVGVRPRRAPELAHDRRPRELRGEGGERGRVLECADREPSLDRPHGHRAAGPRANTASVRRSRSRAPRLRGASSAPARRRPAVRAPAQTWRGTARRRPRTGAVASSPCTISCLRSSSAMTARATAGARAHLGQRSAVRPRAPPEARRDEPPLRGEDLRGRHGRSLALHRADHERRERELAVVREPRERSDLGRGERRARRTGSGWSGEGSAARCGGRHRAPARARPGRRRAPGRGPRATRTRRTSCPGRSTARSAAPSPRTRRGRGRARARPAGPRTPTTSRRRTSVTAASAPRARRPLARSGTRSSARCARPGPRPREAWPPRADS